MSSTYILGISAYYHDSAAALLKDGEIVAAAQEERFTRKKGDPDFPARSVEFCLKTAGIEAKDLSYVGFYDKPLLKFERILETYLGVVPKGFKSFLMAGPLWVKEKLHMEKQLRKSLGYTGPILYSEHHESHAASAFFPSPFEEAAILTMDGVGEWATAAIGVGRGNDIELTRELKWPDSLGLLYSAFTYFTGFKVNSGEYKVMGLAPYGEPKYVDAILNDADRPAGRRVVQDEPEVLQLPEWPDDDERPHGRALRGPAAGAGVSVDAARDGHRALDPGGDGRDHDAHGEDCA